MASTETALLGTFQKHIEDMRALVQCKVCLKPFYEPFTLSCGHTYCYSCLSSWLGGSHNRSRSKNCPDCRAEIRTEPCPNYTLRDLVHMFLNRAELIPEDETIQEHETGKAEEARILAADRSGRGLFKGVFTRPRITTVNRPPHLPIADHPIWDEEDLVERCPSCTHELEDGLCNHCGWEDRDFSDDSVGDVTEEMYDSEDLDSDGMPRSSVEREIHTRIVEHLPFGFNMDYYDQQSQASEESVPIRRYVPRGYPRIDEYGEEVSDVDPLDEASSEMDDFIENDEDHDHPDERDGDSDGESTSMLRGVPYEYDSPRPYDSDEDSETTARRSPNSYDIHYHYEVSSDPTTDDDGYESGHVPQNPRTTASYNIDYDSEPTEDLEHDSIADDQTNYDSDSSSIQEVPPPPRSSALSNRSRARHIVDDSDDEDEVQEVEDDEPPQSAPPPFSSDDDDVDDINESDDSEESDDTAIRGPPQASSLRQRRLRQRRANNGHRVARELSVEGQSGYGSYGSQSPSQMGRRRLRPTVDLTQPSRSAMRVH